MGKLCLRKTHEYYIQVHAHAVFVIDSRSLKSPNDVRADDLGVWVNNGVRRCIVTCTSSRNVYRMLKCFPIKYLYRQNI